MKIEERKPFKILCIDGGGIKGLFSAQVLSKFEEVFNTEITEHFDLICGTSTGGIIALAASAKIPMSDVVDFYKSKGPLIVLIIVASVLLMFVKQLHLPLIVCALVAHLMRKFLAVFFCIPESGDIRFHNACPIRCVFEIVFVRKYEESYRTENYL